MLISDLPHKLIMGETDLSLVLPLVPLPILLRGMIGIKEFSDAAYS
jgi:hypothetical protein